jgi:hypothetical protein
MEIELSYAFGDIDVIQSLLTKTTRDMASGLIIVRQISN